MVVLLSLWEFLFLVEVQRPLLSYRFALDYEQEMHFDQVKLQITSMSASEPIHP
jgi:hypothetical protein